MKEKNYINHLKSHRKKADRKPLKNTIKAIKMREKENNSFRKIKLFYNNRMPASWISSGSI